MITFADRAIGMSKEAVENQSMLYAITALPAHQMFKSDGVLDNNLLATTRGW